MGAHHTEPNRARGSTAVATAMRKILGQSIGLSTRHRIPSDVQRKCTDSTSAGAIALRRRISWWVPRTCGRRTAPVTGAVMARSSRRIQDRPRRPRCAAVQQGQGQRKPHEDHSQDRRGAGQQVGGAATGHERAHALGTADAKPTALGPLDQDDADQGQGDKQMDDQQYGAQRAGLSHKLSRRWPEPFAARASYPAWAARAIARNSCGFRLAPPTSAPPTLGTASSDAALAGLDRTAIQDADRLAGIAELADQFLANEGVHGRRHRLPWRSCRCRSPRPVHRRQPR